MLPGWTAPTPEYVEEVLSLLPYELDDNNDCPYVKEGRGIKVTWRAGARPWCAPPAQDINTVHVAAQPHRGRGPHR